MSGAETSSLDDPREEVERLRAALAAHERQAAEKEDQLERYAADLRETFKEERARAHELRESYFATVRALTNAVEARDAYTGKHAERVAAYALQLGAALGQQWAGKPEIEFGFLLHDVGKVGVPEAILNKPGPLSAAEWRVMRTHPTIGAQILSGIPGMENAAEVVRCHHEMWSGDGYPAGLEKEEIPLPARVFMVVDAYDAMTTDRPYRASIGVERAVGELQRVAGTQFDPDVVRSFVGIVDSLPSVV